MIKEALASSIQAFKAAEGLRGGGDDDDDDDSDDDSTIGDGGHGNRAGNTSPLTRVTLNMTDINKLYPPSIKSLLLSMNEAVDGIAEQSKLAGRLATFPAKSRNALLPIAAKMLPLGFEPVHNDNMNPKDKKRRDEDDDNADDEDERKWSKGGKGHHTVATAVVFLSEVEPDDGGWLVFPYLRREHEGGDSFSYHGTDDYRSYKCKHVDKECLKNGIGPAETGMQFCCCMDLLRIR